MNKIKQAIENKFSRYGVSLMNKVEALLWEEKGDEMLELLKQERTIEDWVEYLNKLEVAVYRRDFGDVTEDSILIEGRGFVVANEEDAYLLALNEATEQYRKNGIMFLSDDYVESLLYYKTEFINMDYLKDLLLQDSKMYVVGLSVEEMVEELVLNGKDEETLKEMSEDDLRRIVLNCRMSWIEENGFVEYLMNYWFDEEVGAVEFLYDNEALDMENIILDVLAEEGVAYFLSVGGDEIALEQGLFAYPL